MISDQMLPAEPVLVVPDGDEVQLSCRSCSGRERVALEPTSELLATIDAFVAAHAQCGRPLP